VTNIQKEVVIGGLAARLAGIPNVRRIGNDDDLNDRVRWRQTHLVDHSIVPCNFTLEKAAGRLSWIEPDRFTTIYNGVDPVDHSEEEKAGVRRGWGLPPDATVIGCTSGLAKVKGLNNLISAFARLAVEYPNTYLVLTGEGPEETDLRGLVRAAGIEGRVVFAGFTAEPTKAAAAYDIAVLNSSIEGFPNVVIEYMGTGIPVVSTRVGGVGEILLDRVNGLLIEPGDVSALVESLQLLLADPGLRSELGRRARQTVDEGFSGNRMVDRVEKLFKKITDTGAR
jgi:glycosyltransferase involved in cell wall biosynthesis